MEKLHYIHNYLLNPVHPITVNVIGAGGNGSQVLTQLARIDQALKKLGHLGLHVTCFDDDIITEANIGRQLYSPVDIGMHKCVVLITRMNRYFGTSWIAKPIRYRMSTVEKEFKYANLTISCVDMLSSRMNIRKILEDAPSTSLEPYQAPLYWMDMGNAQHTGQFVVSTVRTDNQPESEHPTVRVLKNMFELFPHLNEAFELDDDNTPSCSLAEALEKQDLFINSTLVQLAMGLVWKMFREGRIDYQGAFLNLKTLHVAKINL